MIVNPNFRELHVAEQPAPLRPLTRAVQAALRRYGDGHELTHLCRASLADARVVAQNAGLER